MSRTSLTVRSFLVELNDVCELPPRPKSVAMPEQFRNSMLRGLRPEDAERITTRGHLIVMASGDVVYEQGDPVSAVYFPETSLLSLMVTTSDGRAAEGGLVGNEGALGLGESMGTGVMGPRCITQVPGKAWRVPAGLCRELVNENVAFRRAAFAHLEFQMAEARQSVTCRSFHAVEARLARWLLESRDRSGAEGVLPMTQEFLAAMLGVQRTTVSAFAPELQSKGLIRYGRGKLEIMDVQGLEVVACECRRALVQERMRITGAAIEPSERKMAVAAR